jgi:hypothetical protein
LQSQTAAVAPNIVSYLYDFHNRGVQQLLLTRNLEVESLLKAHKLPDFFIEIRVTADKLSELENLVKTYGFDLCDCVLVNDSHIENLTIQERFPYLRTLTPDVLELLGWEKIE